MAIRRHVIHRGFEQHGSLRHGLAAPPQPHGPRVTRCRRHALAMGARQQQRVGIEPVGAALRLRQRKAIRDEALRRHVELAQHHGVAAAARQAQHRARAAGQRGDLAQQPVFALARCELVDIQHGLPRRTCFAKFVQRSPPPQAARVGGVLPEIVQIVAASADIGNVVGAIVDRSEHVAVVLPGLAAERLQRQLVLPLDEIERLLALDLLQPQKRIVVGRLKRGPVVDGHEQNSQKSRRIRFDRAQAVKGAAGYHRTDCVGGMACARLRRLPAHPHPSIVPGISQPQ